MDFPFKYQQKPRVDFPDKCIFTPNQTIPIKTDKVTGTVNTHRKILSIVSATTDKYL